MILFLWNSVFVEKMLDTFLERKAVKVARIPEHEVERLKKEISVQRLAEARGIKLARQGANLVGKCPFHDDRTPSLVITPGKNLWHCMGACNVGGTVIDWVMKTDGVSFRHAVELLKADYFPLAADPINPVKKSTVPKLPPPVSAEAGDQELLLEVVDYYNRALKQSPEALKYLESRGLHSSEMIDRFRLGFANRTLGYGLEAKNRAAGAAVRGRLQELGIYRKSGHEQFNGSLVIPVLNPAGDVLEMYGRKITPNLREGTPLHLYLKGEHRGVWNEEALAVSKDIVLCEALIDALTFWAADIRQVTASYGVNGFTADHRAAFEKHGTERVYIAYDNDEAGNKAAAKLAEELIGIGIECFRVEFPKGMDANEYARKVTPAAKSLGVLLNRAAWLGKGQRSPVIVPAPGVEPPPAEAKTAAKEKIIEDSAPAPIVAATPTADAPAVEPASKEVFSLAAVPVPAAPTPIASIEPMRAESEPMPGRPVLEMCGEDAVLKFGDREYRARGLKKNTSGDALRVNLRILGVNAHGDMALHVDTLDLHLARQRAAFAKLAADELGLKEETIRHDLGKVLVKLEELRDREIEAALKKPAETVQMSEDERGAALDLLRDPRLMERVLEDFARCGVTGEEINKQVGYLASVSRLLEAPLAVIVQSSSAAGKSSLMEAVLAFMPEEQRVQYSAMTGQSLFYMGEADLKHKILAIVEEEGAQRASYALKLLQSEGVLSIASTGKDPVSGRLITHQYRVEGPVMIFLTTTAIDIDEELLNRCLILSVDEEREQTRAIHRLQRESQTLTGLLKRRERTAILTVHRNAQRLLRPISVVNPHAMELSFPDSMTRTRRDHMKFLTLIRTSALLHQYQRETKMVMYQGQQVEYIEATEADVELAKKLIHEVMGRSLDDLPSQTRRLLLLTDGMVTAECERRKIERGEYRFSRRDVREFSGWSDSQLKRHLARLEELEYLIVHRGGRGQSFVYELFFERRTDAARPTLPGLECEYDEKKSDFEGQKSGPSLGGVRGMSGGGSGKKSPVSIGVQGSFYEETLKNTDKEETEEEAVVAGLHRNNGSKKRGQ
jgi:DNA primase catalytic core